MMTNINRTFKSEIDSQKGVSLIELMIGLLLGSLLLLGVFKIYQSMKHSINLVQAEAELQENARFSFAVISSIVQNAGKYGCVTSIERAHRSLVDNTDTIIAQTFHPEHGIEGWEATGTGRAATYNAALDAAVITTPNNHWYPSQNTVIDSRTKSVPHSDILKIWYTKKASATVSAVSGGVLTMSAIDLEAGNIIAISDCQSLTFAQVCSCDTADATTCEGNDERADVSVGSCNTPGNKTMDFSQLNIPTSNLYILDEVIFFIGKRDDNRDNPPSLYVRHLGSNATPDVAEEILEGVESMQILYGEDSSGDYSADAYISANQVVNWQRVVSLKISLLLRSTKKQVFTQQQVVNFNGAPITYSDTTDKHLRRVFSSTISLRNRAIGF